MSFRCGLCNEVSSNGERAEHAVLEWRTVPLGERTVRQIVREVLAHTSCAATSNVAVREAEEKAAGALASLGEVAVYDPDAAVFQ